MEDMKHLKESQPENPEDKKIFRRYRCQWEENIKVNTKEIWSGLLDQTELADDRIQKQVFYTRKLTSGSIKDARFLSQLIGNYTRVNESSKFRSRCRWYTLQNINQGRGKISINIVVTRQYYSKFTLK